jgi:hypothetical protein
MENDNYSPRIMGIFGTGRSGSSWLGSIIDSHPQVAYRFEPFHRIKQNPTIFKARELLESESLTESDLVLVYNALLPAHPKIERPPFFPKEYGLVWGKTGLRAPAMKFNGLLMLFKWLYTARSQPPLVFKEVTMEPIMANLLAHTSVPVVYLVRHPCAVVASTVSGQKLGVMPIGRHSILAELLKKHDPQLAAQYAPLVEGMDLLERETLLWRIDVEKGLNAARDHSNALVVLYEALCDDPLAVSKRVFEHFSLDFSEQTVQFLDALGHQQQTRRLMEFGIKPYFSVFRNPAAMKNKWKQNLSAEEQRRVLRLVQDSPAFQFCAALGKWD